jgi:hypothetical protein
MFFHHNVLYRRVAANKEVTLNPSGNVDVIKVVIITWLTVTAYL